MKEGLGTWWEVTRGLEGPNHGVRTDPNIGRASAVCQGPWQGWALVLFLERKQTQRDYTHAPQNCSSSPRRSRGGKKRVRGTRLSSRQKIPYLHPPGSSPPSGLGRPGRGGEARLHSPWPAAAWRDSSRMTRGSRQSAPIAGLDMGARRTAHLLSPARMGKMIASQGAPVINGHQSPLIPETLENWDQPT